MSDIPRLINQLKEISLKTSNELSALANVFSAHAAAEHDLFDLQHIDAGLIEFWRMAETAELFKDITYGQWGLKILSPLGSRRCTLAEQKERPEEMRPTDLVFAEFLGDSDQLLMDLSFSNSNRQPIYVKSPIDKRHSWPKIADSFEEFLGQYVRENGEKFWEHKVA
jgi:hypothetical protein